MKYTTITYILLAVITIFGYNAFLIKRDAKLFEAYDTVSYDHPTYEEANGRKSN